MSNSERASEVRVLLADDSSAFRRTLRALLAELPGVRVVGEAADANEAVAVAEHTNPDVVLLDLVMPGGGGASAARRIKSAASARRVILMSLLEQRELALAARSAGADGFISKSDIDTRLTEALDLGA
jgi:two-component system nitrate/nitrite response regulator NarL